MKANNGNQPSSQWRSNVLLVVIAVGLVAVISLLVEQNRSLKQALASPASSTSRAGAAASARLDKGDVLTGVQLVGNEGQLKSLEEVVGESGGVLAILTTTCQFCLQTLPVWEQLEAELGEIGIPFAAVSLHSPVTTQSYAESNGIPYPVWSLANPGDGVSLKIVGVPVTVVYGRGRRAEAVWNGVLDESQVPAIVAAASTAVKGESHP